MNAIGHFVILYHYFTVENHENAPTAHFDLLFEEEDHLRAWRIPADLSDASSPIPFFLVHPMVDAEELPPHRRCYLQYEGEISKNRGFVRCWDKGVFRLLSETVNHLAIQLQSPKTNKIIDLTRDCVNHWKLQLMSTEVIHD